jgi:hypothetical protein
LKISLTLTSLLVFTWMFFGPGSRQSALAGPGKPPPGPSPKIFLPFVQSGLSEKNLRVAEWFDQVNQYRSMAGLPDVKENTSWSLGIQNHARYAVKNNLLGHDEDPDNAWYTPEGQAAARTSNLMASSDMSTSDRSAIDSWMQAPFHSLGILDPKLHTVGFGSYREQDGDLQMAAGLDVLRGLGSGPGTMQYPIIWPGPGSVVWLFEHFNEYPDPLSSCPGYTSPSGLPILIQVGDGSRSPRVTDHRLTVNGVPVEHCVFSENTYKNSDSKAQETGRSILNARDAVVVIPRDPMVDGATYTVSVTVNGLEISWSFQMGMRGR